MGVRLDSLGHGELHHDDRVLTNPSAGPPRSLEREAAIGFDGRAGWRTTAPRYEFDCPKRHRTAIGKHHPSGDGHERRGPTATASGCGKQHHDGQAKR
jgi:hypothetical protein